MKIFAQLNLFKKVIVLSMFMLFGITVIGHFRVYTGVEENVESEGNNLRQNLVAKIRSIEDAQQYLFERKNFGGVTEKEKMDLIFDLVTNRFVHRNLRHTVFTNWIMWFLGIPHPEIRAMRVADNILKYGNHGLCSQASYILLTLAEKNSIPARHVAIKGTHVIMEAWYDGAWHMYDPDFEVKPTVNGNVLSVEKLSENSLVLEKFYEKVPLVIERLPQKQLHSYARRGDWFIWSSHALMLIEIVANYLKFLVPILVIVLTMTSRKKGRING